MPSHDKQPAGLLRRLVAGFYDSLLIIALWFMATALLLPFSGGEGIRAEHPGYLLYLILITGLFFFVFWSRNGQTLGMQAWRIRVTGVDGRPATHGALLLRTAVLLALLVTALYGVTLLQLETAPDWAGALLLAPMALSVLWVVVDEEKAGLHDRLSGTRVVRLPRR